MAAKVEFLPSTRVIQITESPTSDIVELDFRTDVYSDGKEDWISDPVLGGMRFPIRVVGGDPINAQLSVGATFFLQFGWRIRPFEADHTFFIDGNLYTESGDEPVLNTTGSFNVRTILRTSNLVDQVASANEIAAQVWGSLVDEYVRDTGDTLAKRVIGGSAYDLYPR